jgi:hypothetical protein
MIAALCIAETKTLASAESVSITANATDAYATLFVKEI